MDNDIRDLTADYDLFDPFEDDEEEDEVVVPAAPDDDAVVGAPLEEKAAPAKEELPPEERIKNLLDSMRGQKKLLLRVIDYCRDPKTAEEMDAFTLDLQQYCYSVYTPVVLRELLQEAGAIEYLVEDEEGHLVPAYVQGEESVALASENPTEAKAADGEENSVSADDYFLSGGVLCSIDESQVHHESLIEDGEEVQLDYLEVEPSQPGVWCATDEGVAAVDAVDYLENTQELLQKEPQYLDIYHQILQFCAEEEYGRSAKEIDNLVNDSPLLQEPRRYSGYFVSRLENQGAVEWRSGWCITEVGRSVLADYQAKAEEGVENE